MLFSVTSTRMKSAYSDIRPRHNQINHKNCRLNHTVSFDIGLLTSLFTRQKLLKPGFFFGIFIKLRDFKRLFLTKPKLRRFVTATLAKPVTEVIP